MVSQVFPFEFFNFSKLGAMQVKLTHFHILHIWVEAAFSEGDIRNKTEKNGALRDTISFNLGELTLLDWNNKEVNKTCGNL